MHPTLTTPAASAKKTAHWRRLTSSLACTIAFAVLPVQAQRADTTRTQERATRARTAPLLDGRDTDEVWRQATPLTGFRMFEPVEDGPPSMETEARVAFDEANLYVFVRAFDPRPDSIIALLSRRDVKTASDQIKLMVDSYHDRRTGYEFGVNPAGVKRDYYTYDDAVEDISWDAVWDVATRVDSLGWTAEFRIPLSQLRYPPGDTNTFGLMIMRDIARRNERDSWPVYRRSRTGIASQFGELTGLTGLGSPTRLELSPYLLTRNAATERADGFVRSQQATIGGDVKYGLTSNLTLDATVNPDFGQVEADPAQLNLTAFETFLEERRPFFLEGTSIFGFGDDPTRLFYSRRIGRAPQLAGLASDPTVSIPGATRILGAGKLSGRLANGTSAGALVAVTDRALAGPVEVEPRTTYGVLRATRDFRDGESAVGLVGTLVNRSLDATLDPYLRRQATALGADGRHRFAGGRYAVAASVSATTVRGTRSAIARTQRSTVHLFQRPDDALVVDTTRESLGGVAWGISADKTAGVVRGGLSYQRVGPGFESNDLGFLSRADQQTITGSLRALPTRPYAGWRNVQMSLVGTQSFTAAGLLNSTLYELYMYGVRPNGAQVVLDAWVENAGTVFCDRCARGGPALRVSPTYNVLVNLIADPKQRVAPLVAAIYSVGDQGRSMLWRVRPYVTVRPSSRVGFELGTRYQRNQDNTQWITNRGAAGSDTTHYLFGYLAQDLLSFTSRLDVTLKPTLTVQLYAEPFVTAGHYTNVRELASPRAADYDARFKPYGPAPDADFNEKSLHASAVLRWEYQPGSTLFLVWTQGREQTDRDAGSFAAMRDYRNLFAARPDNVFLVKASYWLGR